MSFLVRMVAPGAAIFVLGVGLMGQFADPAVFQPKPFRSAAGTSEALPEALAGTARGGIRHWRKMVYFSSHVPEVCWGDQAVSDFQRRQCGEFWEGLKAGLLLSALPFALMALFLWVASKSNARVHRLSRKRLEGGKPQKRGVVTNPPSAPSDLFSWVHGFRPVALQLAGGEQIKVYLRPEQLMPRPGDSFVVFESVRALGAQRHFGKVYAPHVAVVRGVR